MDCETPLPLSRAQVRAVDSITIEQFGIPGIDLMERAGQGCAESLRARTNGPVAVCCGKGNNGGDGFVIARRLSKAGISISVFLAAEASQLTGDARLAYERLRREAPDVPVSSATDAGKTESALAAADWVVDALLGTGLTGTVRPPLDSLIDAINRSGNPVYSVDIPSGLDCDTGRPLGPCVRATMTGTFVAPKRGFAPAESFTGPVEVIDIGAPDEAVRLARETAD